MLRIGLTGGIGSGKSTAARALADLGAVVVDADAVAREVVEPGRPALAEVARRFGADVIAPDGALDRAALGRIVFGDPAALRDLEGITHPAIWARTAELVDAAPRTPCSSTTCPSSSRSRWWGSTTSSSSSARPRTCECIASSVTAGCPRRTPAPGWPPRPMTRPGTRPPTSGSTTTGPRRP